jgi:nicotinamidase-related amidase
MTIYKEGLLGKNPVILVIDVQHDFMDRGGAIPSLATSVSGPKEVIQNIHRLVESGL